MIKEYVVYEHEQNFYGYGINMRLKSGNWLARLLLRKKKWFWNAS